MERIVTMTILSFLYTYFCLFYNSNIPRPSYTLSLLSFPQRIALSSAMTIATTPSIFSVDFSLSGLMFPAGSLLMKMLSIIHRSTGCLPWAIFFSSVSFISSFVGGLISLKPCPNGTTVKPMPSRFCTICTAPHRSKAISLMLNRSPRLSMNFSM